MTKFVGAFVVSLVAVVVGLYIFGEPSTREFCRKLMQESDVCQRAAPKPWDDPDWIGAYGHCGECRPWYRQARR